MQEFPHHYRVAADARVSGNVTLASKGLSDLASAPPEQFGGPGDQWSPEALLVASVADCFILSFRAVARASKLEWTNIECEVEGTLDKIDRVTQFTAFRNTATLEVAAGTDLDKARRILEKAEHVCLISNSLKAESELTTTVNVATN